MAHPRTLFDVQCAHCNIVFQTLKAGRKFCSPACYQQNRFPADPSPVGSKQCRLCKETKPLSDYNRHPNSRYGRQSRCKLCAAQVDKMAYAADPELRKASARTWQAANPDRTMRTRRKYKLKSYGLALDEFESMMNQQGGQCAICRSDVPGRGRKEFSVDHDHKTGKVRGLLCGACNQGLGCFRDVPEFLIAAAYYLISNNSKGIPNETQGQEGTSTPTP